MDLTFDKVSYLPKEDITGTAPGPGSITVSHLGVPVSTFQCDESFNVGTFPEGGYSLLWIDGVDSISSSFEVLSDSWDRLRYGFVAEFSDSVVTKNYQTWAKKLHLTAVQFYDWAWRHEILTTNQTHYDDPMGQEISTAKIQELIAAYKEIGATSCGYVAVYAVDMEGWARWKQVGLYDSQGVPYQLGDDFLRILDPADPVWLDHLITQLQKAHEFGFPAFHLDQYGYPRMAMRSDGSRIDLTEQFPKMLNKIVESVPECRHIFNNVNDFPTWTTTKTNQDATYIEVWDPHSTYGNLANLVSKTRELNSKKPIILSAYLKPFGEINSDENLTEAVSSFELTSASIISGGASHLILGGNGRVLYHAYYVTNYLASGSALDVFQKHYDFVVAAGDLLYDPTRVDVTRNDAFGVNTEVQFTSEVPCSSEAIPKNLWIRIFKGQTGLTIHIINLLDQEDSIWDKPKKIISTETELTISVDAVGYSSQASIGYSADGAAFELKPMQVLGNRLLTTFDIHGPWTIVNIPLKSRD
ncbi:MAG TPA: glycoside hydrolase family 66 protein [archaeon]|nr:glycoside hydrolase family 66 protein [archaeon]